MDDNAIFAPGMPWHTVSDERREIERNNNDGYVSVSAKREQDARRQDRCPKCLVPVDWRMDHREETTTIWVNYDAGTRTPHRCPKGGA